MGSRSACGQGGVYATPVETSAKDEANTIPIKVRRTFPLLIFPLSTQPGWPKAARLEWRFYGEPVECQWSGVDGGPPGALG